MIKNTIIRIDENNLIMLEIDPEEHSGQGGILDTETGTFYPFSTVVDPTKSSIVRFDDTNVVLIKLDPDTHDSSAIIMDEVSGNVYPLGPTGPQELKMEIGSINSTTGADEEDDRRLRTVNYIPVTNKITVTGCPWTNWDTITNTSNPSRGGYFFRCYDDMHNLVGTLLDGTNFFLADINNETLPTGTSYVRMIIQRFNQSMPNNWASSIINTIEINGVEYEVTD